MKIGDLVKTFDGKVGKVDMMRLIEPIRSRDNPGAPDYYVCRIDTDDGNLYIWFGEGHRGNQVTPEPEKPSELFICEKGGRCRDWICTHGAAHGYGQACDLLCSQGSKCIPYEEEKDSKDYICERCGSVNRMRRLK